MNIYIVFKDTYDFEYQKNLYGVYDSTWLSEDSAISYCVDKNRRNIVHGDRNFKMYIDQVRE